MKINPRPPVDAGHEVTRRVLAETPEIMLVEFAFAEGGEGLPHAHPHVQSTFVKAGRYRFTVGDESFEVGPGDAFVVGRGRACRPRPWCASRRRLLRCRRRRC
jgi:quercetin dioxygenase-like cupin family protein